MHWLDTMPVVNDEEAAPFAYGFLGQLIDQYVYVSISQQRLMDVSTAQLLTVHLQTKPRSHAERGPLLHLYRASPRGRDATGPDGAKGRRLGQKTHWYRWSGRQSIACRSQRRNAGDGQGVLWLSM